jgi:hypothetical protein
MDSGAAEDGGGEVEEIEVPAYNHGFIVESAAEKRLTLASTAVNGGPVRVGVLAPQPPPRNPHLATPTSHLALRTSPCIMPSHPVPCHSGCMTHLLPCPWILPFHPGVCGCAGVLWVSVTVPPDPVAYGSVGPALILAVQKRGPLLIPTLFSFHLPKVSCSSCDCSRTVSSSTSSSSSSSTSSSSSSFSSFLSSFLSAPSSDGQPTTSNHACSL